MHGAERIGNEQVRKRCELLCKFRIVLFLFFIEARVLEQNDFAVFHVRDRCLCAFADRVGCKPDAGIGQQLCKTLTDRFQRILRIDLTFGSAEVRAKDNLRFVIQKILDRRKCSNDALIVRNGPVLRERYVKVHAHENSLAGYVDIFDRHFCHSCIFLSCNFCIMKRLSASFQIT